MWLTRLSIARPIVLWMALAAIAVLGVVSYSRLPAELNPRVPIPTLTVVTVYPGAGPPEVEEEITRPVEDAVGAFGGIQTVHSSSQGSVSIVSVSFRVGTSLETALSAVRERMDAVRADLPADARTPIVAKLDINAQPVIYAALCAGETDASPAATNALRVACEVGLKPRLLRIPGVAAVTVSGGDATEVQVIADARRIGQVGVTLEDVVNAVKGAGRNVPAGAMELGGRETAVRAVGAFETLNDIAAAQLLSLDLMASRLMPDLPFPGAPRRDDLPAPVTVSDVADVRLGTADPTVLSRVDGRSAVALIVTKAPDANAIAVADEVRRELHAARGRDVPVGTVVSVLRDESGIVRDALHDVNVTLVLGAMLAVGVVLVFLRNFRGTVIVAVALPACLAATYLVIYFAGFTLNQMTLLALSLSVGILVDDSIVVLESITRHLRLGEEPREAAFTGRTEIGFAGIALTLADVVVFLPIAFMGGIVGAFFREFGLTVAFATLFSLLVSFTVTPALASRWYRSGERLAVAGGSRLDETYGRALRWALARPGWVLGWGATALAAVLLLAAPNLGFEFLPASDQGQISIGIEAPAGSSLPSTDRVVRQVERRLKGIGDIRHAMTTVGEVIGGFGSIPRRGPEHAQINITLKELADPVSRRLGRARIGGAVRARGDSAVADEIRRALADVAGARIVVAPVRTVANIGRALQVELQGHDLDALAQATRKAEEVVGGVDGVVRPDTSLRVAKPELQVEVDRVRAAACGVPPAQAGSLVRTAVAGAEAGRILLDGRSTPIWVRLAATDRGDPDALRSVPLGASGGRAILLGDLAGLRFATGPAAIERVNGMRMMSVTADLAPGYALGNVTAEVDRRLEGALPEGITYTFGGESGVMAENMPHFVLAVALAVVLLYLVTAALFNSLVYPLIMMLTLPMALIGGLAALVIYGETLSLVSMIGVIMLIGLMGRNAILLIDYTNTLRLRGLRRADALREAGVARLRPIAMTTLATVFGMLPVAMRMGRASELRAPMAIVVIGGLLVSTVLTLIVIPVAYDLADRLLGRHDRVVRPRG